MSSSIDAAYDPYPGNISNATVTFVNREASNAVLCGPVAVVLVNSSDTTTGVAWCSFTGTVGASEITTYTSGSSWATTTPGTPVPMTPWYTAGLLYPTPGTKNNFGGRLPGQEQLHNVADDSGNHRAVHGDACRESQRPGCDQPQREPRLVGWRRNLDRVDDRLPEHRTASASRPGFFLSTYPRSKVPTEKRRQLRLDSPGRMV